MGLFNTDTDKLAANAAHVDAVRNAESVLADITSKLGTWAAHTASLTIRHAEIAFNTSTGIASVADFTKIDEQLSAARFEVGRLSAARGVAAQKLNEAKLAARRNARADIVKTFTRRANQRVKKAERVAAAVSELSTAWNGLLSEQEAISIAWPNEFGELPRAADLGSGQILRALEQELFRCNGRTRPAVPGAAVYRHDLREQPDQIPKFVDVIMAGNAALLQALDNEATPVAAPIAPVADELLTPLLPSGALNNAGGENPPPGARTAAQIATTLGPRTIRLSGVK